MIEHNYPNWHAHAGRCMRCTLHDLHGLCARGVYHADHVNAGYCPEGVFGSKEKPSAWPEQLEKRLNTCRGCPQHQGGRCAVDRATIRAHADEAICPLGRYLDGIIGRIETPPATTMASSPAAQGKGGEGGGGCCSGSKTG